MARAVCVSVLLAAAVCTVVRAYTASAPQATDVPLQQLALPDLRAWPPPTQDSTTGYQPALVQPVANMDWPAARQLGGAGTLSDNNDGRPAALAATKAGAGTSGGSQAGSESRQGIPITALAACSLVAVVGAVVGLVVAWRRCRRPKPAAPGARTPVSMRRVIVVGSHDNASLEGCEADDRSSACSTRTGHKLHTVESSESASECPTPRSGGERDVGEERRVEGQPQDGDVGRRGRGGSDASSPRAAADAHQSSMHQGPNCTKEETVREAELLQTARGGKRAQRREGRRSTQKAPQNSSRLSRCSLPALGAARWTSAAACGAGLTRESDDGPAGRSASPSASPTDDEDPLEDIEWVEERAPVRGGAARAPHWRPTGASNLTVPGPRLVPWQVGPVHGAWGGAGPAVRMVIAGPVAAGGSWAAVPARPLPSCLGSDGPADGPTADSASGARATKAAGAVVEASRPVMLAEGQWQASQVIKHV